MCLFVHSPQGPSTLQFIFVIHKHTYKDQRLLNYRVFLQENWVLNLLKPS